MRRRTWRSCNGECAELAIEEIYGDVYKIDEYDGNETVETQDTIDWIVIK